METFDPVLLRTFAACAAVLVLKMVVVGHVTGILRMRRRAFRNPEDAKAFAGVAPLEQEHPDVDRAMRAHRNDLESTLPFLAIGLPYLAIGPPEALAQALLVAFTALRVLYTLFYFGSMQPWRSLTFIVAELPLAVMLVQMLWYGLGG